jgi:hypothetical protein
MCIGDGNRLELDMAEKLVRTTKRKIVSQGSKKVYIDFKKTVIHKLRLRVNAERYRCKPLPVELSAPRQLSVAGTLLHDEVMRCENTDAGCMLEVSYNVIKKNETLDSASMFVDELLVPQQIQRLYSFLEEGGGAPSH